jgi:transcriptional regulator with XRE-family HTH domain
LDWLLRPRLKATLRGEVSPPPPGWDLGDPVPQGIVDDSSTANEISFADRFCTLIRRRPGVDGKPLSNREIARRTGLSASHIGKLKGGTSESGYRALTSIANCFNVDVSFFFDRHTPTSEALLIYARDQIILEVAARVARMDLKKRQAILRLARVLSEDVIEVTDSEHDDELA